MAILALISMSYQNKKDFLADLCQGLELPNLFRLFCRIDGSD